jgi:hypothetical protein
MQRDPKAAGQGSGLLDHRVVVGCGEPERAEARAAKAVISSSIDGQSGGRRFSCPGVPTADRVP